jgi:hypothetical protein
VKFWLLSAALFIATVYGAKAAIARWPDGSVDPWIFGVGLSILVLGSVAIKISGLDRIRRVLRDVLIGAWLGQALRKAGFYGPRVAKVLRVFGYETAAEGPGRAQLEHIGLSWSRINDVALILGWCGTVIGMALIWVAL